MSVFLLLLIICPQVYTVQIKKNHVRVVQHTEFERLKKRENTYTIAHFLARYNGMLNSCTSVKIHDTPSSIFNFKIPFLASKSCMK